MEYPDQDSERILNMLRDNYQNLHSAYWECHKIYWQMTSIFLPIILAISTLIWKDITNPAILIASFVLLCILLTFWLFTTKYLYSWNETRQDRLKFLEQYLNYRLIKTDERGLLVKLYILQYILPYKEDYKRNFKGVFKIMLYINFQQLNWLLYIFLVIGNFWILYIKLLDP